MALIVWDIIAFIVSVKISAISYQILCAHEFFICLVFRAKNICGFEMQEHAMTGDAYLSCSTQCQGLCSYIC